MRKADQLEQFRTTGKTMSPERVIVLLYERLGRDLEQARAAIAAGDAETRHNALLHAQEIIAELSYAVRPDVWEAGEGLLALYEFVLDLLVKANINADVVPIDQAAKLIADLTAAWQQAYVEISTTAGQAAS